VVEGTKYWSIRAGDLPRSSTINMWLAIVASLSDELFLARSKWTLRENGERTSSSAAAGFTGVETRQRPVLP
jgi:hypothetical protein